VIAGQGTLGLEILTQLADQRSCSWFILLEVVVWLLASDWLSAPKTFIRKSGCSFISCLPFLYKLFHTGTQESVEELPSLADGLAGPVEPGAITIPIVKKTMNEFILVTEEEIRRAIIYAWNKYSERIEGSAATALAAALYHKTSARQPSLSFRVVIFNPRSMQGLYKVSEQPVTTDEVFVTCIARLLHDGETVAQGLATPLITAAYLFARRTHAPNLYFTSAIGQGSAGNQLR